MSQNAPSHKSPDTVDEHVVRLVAALVALSAAVSLYPPLWWLTVGLAVDFAIRGFISPKFSPLALAARVLVRATGLTPKPVYAPPKRFAAQVGTILTCVATILYVAGAPSAAAVVTALLIVAASLEAFAGFCLACWLYPFVFRTRRQQERATGAHPS